MRTIKFRGKTSSGKWMIGDLVRHKDGEVYVFPMDALDSAESYQVVSETVGQFTGLLDKSGKELYEGDIIKAPSGRKYIVIWATWKHEERRTKFLTDIYEFTGWCIAYDINKPLDTLDFEIISGEVIGNIHDNPELINT